MGGICSNSPPSSAMTVRSISQDRAAPETVLSGDDTDNAAFPTLPSLGGDTCIVLAAPSAFVLSFAQDDVPSSPP